MSEVSTRDTYVEELVRVACKRLEGRLLRRLATIDLTEAAEVKIDGKFRIGCTIDPLNEEYSQGKIEIEFDSK